MRILKSVIIQLMNHAKKDAPIEACGYLAAQGGVITSDYELTNTDQSQEHFSFDPKEQFAALKDARAKGMEMVGVYHSHPASPARPSAEDITLAYDPTLIYVIVSLYNGKEEIAAFHIKEQKVEAVNVEVIDDEWV